MVWERPRLVAPDGLTCSCATFAESRRASRLARAGLHCGGPVPGGRHSKRHRQGGSRWPNSRNSKRRSADPGRLARLPGDRHRARAPRSRSTRHSRRRIREFSRLRVRQRLGLSGESADRGRQLVEPACPHSGQLQAAQRGRAPDALLAGGGRLAQPRGARAHDRRPGAARPSGMRQRRDLVARIAPRGGATETRGRHLSRREGGTVGPVEGRAVQPGDLVSISIGPRDGNHSCDLTAVDLISLAADATGDLARSLARDSRGQSACRLPRATRASGISTAKPEKGGTNDAMIPAGSLLASWQSAPTPRKRSPPGAGDSRPADFRRPTGSQGQPGPPSLSISSRRCEDRSSAPFQTNGTAPLGGSRRRMGQPGGRACPGAFRQAAGRAADRSGEHCGAGADGARDPAPRRARRGLRICHWRCTRDRRPARGKRAIAGARQCHPASTGRFGRDTGRGARGTRRRGRFEAAFETIRQVFPPALCYTKIVPVDEVVTLNLFYREDEHLERLMLDEAQTARARPAVGGAALRQPGRAQARRCISPAPGIRLAGC